MNEDRIKGISAIRNESDLKEPVRLILELKRDADPEIVLNQLYQFSPLQDSFSLIFLALVDGKPRTLSFKEMLEEFIRHRVNVIRRRTQFLLAKARQRKHTVEGLLLAHANIDEVIRVIRSSATQAEAKARLMGIEVPRRADARGPWATPASRPSVAERGDAESYTLTAVQADAILRMTLGQLVNLEQEKLAGEYRQAARRDHRVSADPLRRQEHPRHHPRRPARAEEEARRRAPHRDQRRGNRHDRPGRPDHRRDDGRHDQPQRLHQADCRRAPIAPSAAAARG